MYSTTSARLPHHHGHDSDDKINYHRDRDAGTVLVILHIVLLEQPDSEALCDELVGNPYYHPFRIELTSLAQLAFTASS